MTIHWTEDDQKLAENAIEISIEYLKLAPSDGSFLLKRNHHRKVIVNEIEFLKKNFPESETLKQDLSSVNLLME